MKDLVLTASLSRNRATLCSSRARGLNNSTLRTTHAVNEPCCRPSAAGAICLGTAAMVQRRRHEYLIPVIPDIRPRVCRGVAAGCSPPSGNETIFPERDAGDGAAAERCCVADDGHDSSLLAVVKIS